MIYRYCRVLSGIVSSSSLLSAVFKHHLGTYDSDLAQQLLENLYGDNVLVMSDQIHELTNAYKDIKKIFADVLMNIREFVSNCPEIQNEIPESEKSFDWLDNYFGNKLGHPKGFFNHGHKILVS